MPNRDGTGPRGHGRRRRNNTTDSGGRNFSFWKTVVAPLVGAIINDLRKPDSISRKIFRKLGSKKKNIEQQEHTVIESKDYEILEDKKEETNAK
jgi:hypothetical protein